MCWMCHEQRQFSSYRACEGCSKLFEVQDFQAYDLFKQWGEWAEFVEQYTRVVLFCTRCQEAMNLFRDHLKAKAAQYPDLMVLPEPRTRETLAAIPVGIIVDQQVLGLRCAKYTHGVDLINDVLKGYVYTGIVALTMHETDQKDRCMGCNMPLWMCNAREVTL